MERIDALKGVLVADAAAMGLHWLYDQEHIEQVARCGDVLFRQPDAAIYAGVKGYFAHGARRAGQLSHYGESARLVDQACRGGSYDVAAHQAALFATFGPCGSFVGYADRPTRALIARMIVEGDALHEPSGMDDDQMPALCVVAGVFVAGLDSADAVVAAQTMTTNASALAAVACVMDCLTRIASGTNLSQALAESAATMPDPIGAQMRDALELPEYKPLRVAETWGLACHVHQGLPVIWHILRHAADFESAVRDNIRCGGDSCGRAMALGAIAGFYRGVPESMIGRLAPLA